MIASINGINVNFQVFGEGPPVVLLHGWGDSGANWYQVAERLSKNYQVLLIDLPGFGESDSPQEPWGVEDYRSVVEGFVEELELDSPIVVGHSHGGKIACLYAGDRGACRALVLIAASGLDRRSLETTIRIYFYKTIKHLLGLLGSFGQQQLDKLRNRMGSQDYRQAGAMRATLVKVVNEKLFSAASSVKVPTLIIWGSEDKTLDMKQAKEFRRRIADSFIRILWGSSHHPHLDAPDELAVLIDEFCAAQ